MLKEEIISKITASLYQEKMIQFAYLHGSFQESERYRDIDVAIYVDEKGVKKKESLDLEISLSIRLEMELPKVFDVKILNFAPLSFRYHATRGKLLFSRNEQKREDFLCQTWLEYCDFLYLSRRYIEEVTRG